MARLWGSGIELNATGSGVEFTVASNFTIDTTTVRSGTYSYRSNPSASADNFQYDFATSDQTKSLYFRFYMRVASAPLSVADIFTVYNTANAAKVSLRLNTDLTLDVFNNEDAAIVGTGHAALSTNTWYRVELKVDTTTISTTAVEGKVDGTSFGSGTINLATGIAKSFLGSNVAVETFDIYFDDIAYNDNSGSFQNSWPGEGEIIHLRPDSAGDNEAWNDGTGTTFAEVDEVTPDDGTTHIEENTANAITDFNLDATPAALASDDTINVVQVGVRFASEGGSSSNSTFALRIKASAGGTVEEGSTITPASTNYSTNAPAAPRNYNLTLYDLPGESTTAWTKADLDTAQIGVKLVANDFWEARVSTLWLLVDHKPAEAPAGYGDVFISNRDLLGVGV